MKRLLFLLFCLPLFAAAQNQPLLIQGTAPALYLNHTVAAKENYYSIGRLYNISPKEIAPFNKLKLESGLALGQVIMIPLTDNNFLQSGNPTTDEALVPVYYVVHEKEGFYRISVNNNKVPIVSVKKWNNVTSDGVNPGTPLIVGYLKVKKDLSLFANSPTLTTDQVKTAIQQSTVKTNNTVAKSDEPAEDDSIEEEEKPVAKTVTTTTTKTTTSTTTKTSTTSPVATEPVKQQATKEPVKVVAAETPLPTMDFKEDPNKANFKGFYGGTFKNDYAKYKGTTQDESGDAAIFKSNSGWQDGRYYCLYDGVQAGSIVKIADNTTRRVIYAKVLDAMPDMKQNEDILLRISSAAAEELGVTDAKFDCTVTFFDK